VGGRGVTTAGTPMVCADEDVFSLGKQPEDTQQLVNKES
jgi:hypothetical protein